MGVLAYPPEKVYSKGERADCVLLIEGLMCNPFYFNLLEYIKFLSARVVAFSDNCSFQKLEMGKPLYLQ